MTHTPYFKRLSERERALTLNPGVAGLLCEAMEASSDLRGAPPIVRACLLADVAYAYQHYGFDVFAPSARSMLASGLARDTGLAFTHVDRWLEEVAYALLEDFAVLRLLEAEPEWEAVDASFFRAVAKRAICAEPGEAADLGLDCWEQGLVGSLRLAASEALELVRKGTCVDDVAEHAARGLEGRPDARDFAAALRDCLAELHENPLRLLVWRVEGFSSFSDIRQEAKFFVRRETSQVERRAFELAGLLSLLYPHRDADGVRLLEDSPVTLAQMERALLGTSPSGSRFDCALLRDWIGTGEPGEQGNTEETVAARLAQVVAESQRLGLVFELVRASPPPTGALAVVAAGGKARAQRTAPRYGLTRTAMGILRPFAASITLALRAPTPSSTTTVATPVAPTSAAPTSAAPAAGSYFLPR